MARLSKRAAIARNASKAADAATTTNVSTSDCTTYLTG